MRIPLTEVRGAGRGFRRPLLPSLGLAALFLAALSAPAAVPPSLAQAGGTWRRHVCLDWVHDLAATDDALWVATLSGSVIRYDRRSDATRRYTTADGLASDGSAQAAGDHPAGCRFGGLLQDIG